MPYLSKFNKLKKTLDNLESFFTWLRPNLPGGFPPSTFSAKELNFCVRNGNRCILFAIVTTSNEPKLNRPDRQVLGLVYTILKRIV